MTGVCIQPYWGGLKAVKAAFGISKQELHKLVDAGHVRLYKGVSGAKQCKPTYSFEDIKNYLDSHAVTLSA